MPDPVSIDDALRSVTFLAGRTPLTERDDYFATLASYRDGGVFVADYAGTTEWERHRNGDEIVMVLDGATTLFLLVNGNDVPHHLGPREFLVVPQGVWHRFETPDRVKVLTVTPQPTDHSVERPAE
jgi:mannose-6-phosphate isomerase-like protein (cupin superfamily)